MIPHFMKTLKQDGSPNAGAGATPLRAADLLLPGFWSDAMLFKSLQMRTILYYLLCNRISPDTPAFSANDCHLDKGLGVTYTYGVGNTDLRGGP
jgi:hypothetical protein